MSQSHPHVVADAWQWPFLSKKQLPDGFLGIKTSKNVENLLNKCFKTFSNFKSQPTSQQPASQPASRPAGQPASQGPCFGHTGRISLDIQISLVFCERWLGSIGENFYRAAGWRSLGKKEGPVNQKQELIIALSREIMNSEVFESCEVNNLIH